MHKYSAFCVIFSVCGFSLLSLYRESNYLYSTKKKDHLHMRNNMRVKLSVNDDTIFNLGWTITLRSLIKTARRHSLDCWALVNMSISSEIESRHFQRNMEEKLIASPYASDKTDQAQTPPILVNTACLYPDNTHTQPGVNFLLCKVCESPSLKTVIELRWVLLQKLRKCQYDYSDLSISISLWSSAVRVMTVILLHRRCVMKTATRKLWFSISYRLYLWMKLYRCCLQWLWQKDNLSQRKSRIQRETCSLRETIWEPETPPNAT